ncbi:ATP-binding protein [Loktanella sp. R86503]|uniref:PAS domain-containing sensor histidine kinase n=1 Tax=Loktanella sp. R86503 TaxID=3093847 RepID=UPI0036DAB7B7
MRDFIRYPRLGLQSFIAVCSGIFIWRAWPLDRISLAACVAALAAAFIWRRGDASAQVPSVDASALEAHAIVLRADQDGKISFANERLLQLTGYDRSDLMGHPLSLLHHVADAATYAEVEADMKRGSKWTGETRITGKDGRVLWTRMTCVPLVSKSGQYRGSLRVHSDISAQKVSTAARDAMTSLNLLSEPLFMVCLDTYNLVFANDAAAKMFNWNRLQLAEIRIFAVDMLYDRCLVQRQVAALKAKEITEFSFPASYRDVPYLAEVQLIEAAGMQPRLYVVLRDQTESVAIARTKDELVATVSHELRTPLTSIKGALGLIRSGAAGELTKKTSDLLDIAYRNADRLVLIVNDILDLEKMAAGQMDYDMARRDLTQTVKEAVTANEGFASRFDVSINLKADGAPAWAHFDADRIHQVLSNLISNACKFSSTGAQIDVKLERRSKSFAISVVDRGVGIPAGAVERIFDRFTQVGKSARARSGGTGLGLSIVKSIIESHNGTVELTSIEGQGTTVTVVFPKAANKAAPVKLIRSAGGTSE